MPKILLVYASNHGHTAKIAQRLAETMREDGADVHVHEGDDTFDSDPSDYDAVVVGASIHAGHHQRKVVDWVKGHANTLSSMPSAFFSVSLAAAEEDDEARAATRKYLDDFAEETTWTPRTVTTFAGAVQYREYDFAIRLLMRLIVRNKPGHPTDTSHDYDYTDWSAVTRFGHECAAKLAALTTA
jgi:menaquinone-dependent protoporphyrinogen oxidase